MKIARLQNVFRIKAYRAIGKDGKIVSQKLDAQEGPVIIIFRF